MGKFFKILLISFLSCLFLPKIGLALTGYVVTTGPSKVDSLYYTPGPSPGTDAYYQDAMGNNPDVGLMLCDDTLPPNYYVGLVYLMNQEVSPQWVLVSYGKSTQNLPLASITESFEGKQCKRTDIGDFTVSPSYYSDRNPVVYVAAFPARAYILYSTSPYGTSPNFVEATNELSGSYTCSLSYTYSSNTVDFTLNSIIANTGAGTLSIALDDTYRGISTERPILVGVCLNSEGSNCPTGIEKLTSPSFPRTYNFDVSKSLVNDQHTYTRYGVVNGLECGQICIGADVTVTTSVALDPIYYSQNQTIYFTVTNLGNVPVTSPFSVKIEIRNSTHTVHEATLSYDVDLAENGGSFSDSYVWQAIGRSGTYTVIVTVDSNNNLVECNEGNNQDSTTFELKPIILPRIFINGNETTIFPNPGLPYNLTLHLKNSDGLNISNGTVILVEENGVSAFVPTQIWNYTSLPNETSRNGTLVMNSVIFRTDYYGWASLTVIPTGNLLYAPQYAYTQIQETLGNYSIYLKGESFDGEEFVFVVEGKVTRKFPLQLQNLYSYEPEAEKVELPNYENYVETFMNLIYTIFVKFWKMVST